MIHEKRNLPLRRFLFSIWLLAVLDAQLVKHRNQTLVEALVGTDAL